MRQKWLNTTLILLTSIALFGFGLWSWNWFAHKDSNTARMIERLEATSAQIIDNFKVTGFPNRYDFKVDQFNFVKNGIEVDIEELRALTLPAYENQVIFVFPKGLKITINDHVYNIHSKKLRASIDFEKSKWNGNFVLEGQNLDVERLAFNSQPILHFVLAYNPSREDNLVALNLSYEDGTSINLAANSWEELINSLPSGTYLQ